MIDENKSDIHIGVTERIHWVEIDTSSDELIDVDYIITKHNDFFEGLEIFCLSGCCGLDAFRFYSDDIKNAASYVNKILLKSDLSSLRHDLSVSERDIVDSSRFNNLIDKTVFIKLLDHIIGNL